MSVVVPGNIDCALLLEVKERINDVWDDVTMAAEYIAIVDTARAIKDNQTARMKLLETPEKDYNLKVWWADDCRTDDPEDCTDQCELDGPEAGTQCTNYTISECFQLGFSVTEEKLRTSEATEADFTSKQMLKTMKLMDEWINKKSIALFNSAGGTNKFSTGPYTVVGNKTYIPATAWNEDLFGYLSMLFRKNKLTLPKMLSGDLLWMAFWKMQMETTNPTGQASERKFKSIGGEPYFDITLDDEIGEKAVFLFNGASMAIANKARHAAYGPAGRVVPTQAGPPVLWNTIESKNIPGIVYDLYKTEYCANDDVKKVWRLKFRGDFFLNPIGCDTDRTGVLKLVCGNAP